jgi:hypothetical protein
MAVKTAARSILFIARGTQRSVVPAHLVMAGVTVIITFIITFSAVRLIVRPVQTI